MYISFSSTRVTRFQNEQNMHYALLQPGNTLSKRAILLSLASLFHFLIYILAKKWLVDVAVVGVVVVVAVTVVVVVEEH